jgi:hypothetical protein
MAKPLFATDKQHGDMDSFAFFLRSSHSCDPKCVSQANEQHIVLWVNQEQQFFCQMFKLNSRQSRSTILCLL